MIDIQNHEIYINFVDGHEYLDNVGKILKTFTKENQNLQFQIQNNHELVINQPNNNIDSFLVNQNGLRVLGDNDKIKDNAIYLSGKIDEIIEVTNATKFSKIGLKSRVTINNQDFTNNLRDKIFKANNIKYFSLVLNDLRLGDDVTCSTRLFTGSFTNPIMQQRNSGIQIQLNHVQSETAYMLDLDIYFYNMSGKDVKEIKDKINIIANSLSEQQSFMDKISKHIF